MGQLGDLGSAILGAAYEQRLVILVAGLLLGVVLAVQARRRHWLAGARRHPLAFAAILVPVLAIVLPIGWYLTSPLVLTAAIDEPPPVVTATHATPTSSPTAVAPSGPAAPSGGATRPAPTVASAPTIPPAPALITLKGTFHGSDDFHFGRGTARLIETAPGSFVVRLEKFAVRNGPDLYVYLSPSATGYADGAIELGRLKADTGNQNYTVPAGALGEPAQAASVVIWCRQFSHLFATAPLAG